ncbi:unnamed protein product, partial [Prorocentrum cordatum]
AEISAPFAGRSYLIRAGHRRAQHCPRVASPPPSPAPRARQLRGGPTQLTAEPPAQPAPLGRAGSERIPGPAPPGPSSASSAEAGTLRCPGPELTQGRAPPEPNCAWAAPDALRRFNCFAPSDLRVWGRIQPGPISAPARLHATATLRQLNAAPSRGRPNGEGNPQVASGPCARSAASRRG